MPYSAFLPTKAVKQKKSNSRTEEQHLDYLRPFLTDCGLNASKVPTIKEVKKIKHDGLKELHPDRGEGRSESDTVKKNKEEECKR